MEKKDKKDIKVKKTRKSTLEDTQTKLKKIEKMANEIEIENKKEKKTNKTVTESEENKNIDKKENNAIKDNDEKNNKDTKIDINTQLNEKNTKKIKVSSKKNPINLKVSEFILLIVIILLISIFIGYKIGRKDTKQIVLDKNLQQFINIYNNIKENYYDKISNESLISNAVNGMINGLDDYSLYFDEASATTFNAKLAGEYEGLGIEIIGIDNKIIVYNVFKNSPADTCGIQAGDIITKIDELDISNKTTSEISEYIRNSKSEKFNISVKRQNQELNFELKRQKVTINTVTSKVFEKNNKKIGYIYIGIFSNTAYKQFKEELKNLENQNIDSLIIDVRDNTGGHLTTASKILSLFIKSDKVIYQMEKQGTTTKYYSTGKKNFEFPIVILQNSNSASASELLSIALKEQNNATIIGENSYGKGTVQELITLNDGTEYKMTTKKWLSPKGKWINKTGIKPDVEVELSENYYNDPSDENDNQLQEAINYISK